MTELKEKLDKFLDQEGLWLDIKIIFPQYNIIPEEVKLAMKVLENHKGEFIIEVKKEEKDDE